MTTVANETENNTQFHVPYASFKQFGVLLKLSQTIISDVQCH